MGMFSLDCHSKVNVLGVGMGSNVLGALASRRTIAITLCTGRLLASENHFALAMAYSVYSYILDTETASRYILFPHRLLFTQKFYFKQHDH